MKKRISVILLIAFIILLTACSESDGGSTIDSTSPAKTTAGDNAPVFDPYAEENQYDLDASFFEEQAGTDYGTLDTDVSYYSTTAGDTKRVNVLLPPDYNTKEKYPVLYVIHGWGGDYTSHLSEGSYLHLLYGNLYREHLAKPMIIVGVDMYSGILSEKESISDEELRAVYDKTVDDIAVDLMPFIEEQYAVKTGRENTAVVGVSEGGAKSLCTGFKWLDKIGYIAGFAPDTGVIPTEWYKGTFWNTPYFPEFPQPTEENMPIYLYLTVGSEDPWNIDCTEYYSEVLNDMGVRNQFDYVEGFGHDVEFWKVCMYNFMTKLFR